MKKNALLFLFFGVLGLLSAQEPLKNDLHPCGTPAGIAPWLRQYAAQPESYSRGADSALYVKMQLHLLTRNEGTGRIPTARLLDAFCRLNSDYAPANVRFFFTESWNIIPNTTWYVHENLQDGIQMMLTNDVDSAINSYFVSNPAGNCGYNLPYASVAIAHGCAGPNDHTWAHEIGHNLSLPHPFIGWEGKIYNYNDSTPTRVTYDYTYFHDTIDTGPTPLDTAWVELVDGSNCTIAADLFCMTAPDYLAYRWPCDANNFSTVKQRDPNGADFYADGTYYMSYSSDECQSRFSDDQIAALRANLLDEKSSALSPSLPAEPITDPLALVAPLGGATMPTNTIPLVWKPVSGATQYLVQVSRLASFAFTEFEAVTSDTSTITTGLPTDRLFYWRVRPFNRSYTCAGYSTSGSFRTPTSVSTESPSAIEKGWLFPNPVKVGEPFFLHKNSATHSTAYIGQLWSVDGRLIEQKPVNLHEGVNALDFKPILIPGVYQLRLLKDSKSLDYGLIVVD